jgi:amino acid transporter
MKTGGLTTFALAMLITGGVDSVRNLPTTAIFGSALVFFFVLAAIVFLIPSALVSAELTSGCTDKSGIFQWVKSAFGDKTGFLAIWLQWIANMVWFPTILSFIAGLVAYLIDPALASNNIFLVSVILIVFWSLTIVSLKGLHVSAKITTFCAIFGMVIPIAMIIGLAAIWLLLGNLSQIHFTSTNIFPTLATMNTWVSLTGIMASFVGIEVCTVHIKDIRNPQKTFPKALHISVWLILLTMLFGSLAIAIVLPLHDISLVNGVMQAFTSFFQAYHITWFIPIMTVMILIGSLGGISSWIISPAKGLLQTAQIGYLPDFLKKENQHGVAANLLIVQALIVSFVCSLFLFMPSISGSYWLLTALNTQLYMLMYVIMFITGIKMRSKFPNLKRSFMIPGGNFGIWLVSLLGLFGCALTLIIGFFPPNWVNVGSIFHYEMIFCGGMIASIFPVIFFYIYKMRNSAFKLLSKNDENKMKVKGLNIAGLFNENGVRKPVE